MTTCRILLLLLLVTLSAPPLSKAEESEARARRIINSLGCKACHSLEGSGSTLATAFDQIGNRLSMEQLNEQLTRHGNRNSQTFMPDYSTVPDADMNDIVQFLATLK
jgi:cytochrome c553